MALSWNEIKDRALKFTKEWEGESRERAEKDTFWNDFFNVFGISRRRVATFEEPVKKLDNKQGFIDLFWKGTLLVEHKSKGKKLDAAFEQATDYFYGIKEHELPKYVLVSDFENFRLYDLDDKKEYEFGIKDFHKNIKLFGFIAGYQKRTFKDEDPVNIKAAELMGKLYDQLEESGYEGHPLEVFLVRLLFCLFADDTGIFEKNTFREFIELKTNEDGSDLGAWLALYFQVLNTPTDRRLKNLDEHLAAFPHVNGKLFQESLPIASFNSRMREILLECSSLDWGKISPAIFGSMFQSVMNPEERRNLGAHYTSEKNILKLIKPLFLDELQAEFKKVKSNKNKLKEFHQKLGSLKFLDPACGCGNFLIITYRELRLLEMEILKELYGTQQVFEIDQIMLVDVDQFYGIEYEEFPARIAEVAMWLIDHQMNMLISNEFGQYYVRLPLEKAAHIVVGNALQLDWSALIEHVGVDIKADTTNIIMVNEPEVYYDTVNVFSKKVQVFEGTYPITFSGKTHFDYILGNPPFVGKKEQNHEQKLDMQRVFSGVKGFGVLDYVTAWYVKAAQLIANSPTKVAFVSTNSITQGEQVGILWNLLFNHYNIKIHFAHRTFRWSNEAKGNAAVHVVIVGFANYDTNNKRIFEYEDVKSEPHEIKVKNINPYLVDTKDIFIDKRIKPICKVPEISFGSMPNDGGNFLFTDEEKKEFVTKEPESEKFFKPLISAHEFLNGHKRWCLWLKNADPTELKKAKLITERVDNVKKLRAESKRETTQKLAAFPTLFGEDRQPDSDYVLIPSTTSENRKYIPMGFFSKDDIANNSCHIIPNVGVFHFGVLMSAMHMAWVKSVCGRLESRYRYSANIVYNNFPWPENPTEKQIAAIESAVQKVLDTRLEFPNSSLADLYDPLTMPPELVKAHNELDKAVDLAYRPQPFTSEANRMVYLFELYEKYTADLFTNKKQKKTEKTKNDD